MDLGLKGRAAAVAGASKGLGKAAARALAAEGCQVAICSRSQEPLAACAQEIAEEFGVATHYQALDLSQPGAGQDFVEAAHQRFGRLDVLVTNNGGPPAGMFADFSQDDWRRAVEQTLLPALEMARAALPIMKQAGWGRIINMTSISVKQPLAHLILSNSVRAAVVGWAKTLADQVAADGITVNNVCPGFMNTERVIQLMQHQAQDLGKSLEEVRAAREAAIPVGRMGDPAEFGALVAFLAGEQAGYITGASYWIDGGMYRGML